MAYELKLNVKKGTVIGGGLANNAYVEVWIDGMLVETTASVPSPPEWNKEIIKEFDSLEPVTPIIIAFSMYKKRWTSEGFKLVGSAQFPLSDLVEKLNKGPVVKMISLITSKKNITLSGTIQLVLELKETFVVEDHHLSRRALLRKRISGRIPKGGGALLKLFTILTPSKPMTTKEAMKLGYISRAYRYIFHFDNQIFGRFVKMIVVIVWLLIVKYNMDLWASMRTGLQKVEGSIDNLESVFKQLLEREN